MQDFWAWIKAEWNGQMPKEFRKDPKFNRFDMTGPFDNDHQNVRTAYCELRDGKSLSLSYETIDRSIQETILDPMWGIGRGYDDVSKEREILCKELPKMLEKHVKEGVMKRVSLSDGEKKQIKDIQDRIGIVINT